MALLRVEFKYKKGQSISRQTTKFNLLGFRRYSHTKKYALPCKSDLFHGSSNACHICHRLQDIHSRYVHDLDIYL